MTAENVEQPVETCFPPSRFMNLRLSQQRFKVLAAVSFFYELTNSIILFILRFSELKGNRVSDPAVGEGELSSHGRSLGFTISLL